MIMKRNELIPSGYYHCTSVDKEKHIWLTRGLIPMIYLGPASNAPYASDFIKRGTETSLSDIEWEVREATDEEKEAIIQSIYLRKLYLPLKPLEQIYQIF